MSVDPAFYNKSYYQQGNYADYAERVDRYKKTAVELNELLTKLSLLDKSSLIVDYGCALGFLLEGFRDLGYTELIGVEVSDWAIKNATGRGNEVWHADMLAARPLPVTDLLVALDVFEHMTDKDIQKVVSLTNPSALVVRIPSSLDGGKTFGLEVSRADPTHINCKTKLQWKEFLKMLGFNTCMRLNLYTIYDTRPVSCFLCVK